MQGKAISVDEMHSALELAKKAISLVLRGIAVAFLIWGMVFPFVPKGYFALLPFLLGAAIWVLSDFELLLGAKRRSSKSDRGAVYDH